jgi:hypothetical protein
LSTNMVQHCCFKGIPFPGTVVILHLGDHLPNGSWGSENNQESSNRPSIRKLSWWSRSDVLLPLHCVSSTGRPFVIWVLEFKTDWAARSSFGCSVVQATCSHFQEFFNVKATRKWLPIAILSTTII